MSLPRWLAKPTDLSDEAQKYWKTHARRLFRDGVLTRANAESFAALCRLLATARAAEAAINQSGVTIQTKTGATKANPACAVLFAAQRDAAPLLADFGFAEIRQF